ncbi:hypothetical protein Tco_0091445 [Tanacetum coccineum]
MGGSSSQPRTDPAMSPINAFPVKDLYTVWDASINLNTNVGDEDEVQKIQRPGGRDQARAARKNKGSKASGSSTTNDDSLARLMVKEMTAHEKEKCKKNLEIKKGEVECREREVLTQEYRQ